MSNKEHINDLITQLDSIGTGKGSREQRKRKPWTPFDLGPNMDSYEGEEEDDGDEKWEPSEDEESPLVDEEFEESEEEAEQEEEEEEEEEKGRDKERKNL